MAATNRASYAVHAGLSCGLVLAVPVVAYVATIPFSEANDVVSSYALPFTVGALAGVGLLGAVSGIARYRENNRAAEETDSSAAHGAHAPHGSADGYSAMQQADARWFFGKDRAPKGVPIIARAYDAMSEEDAWHDIDALLEDDLPVSCDPARSKDIYEIALEELRREQEDAHDSSPVTGTAQPAPGAAQPVSVSMSVHEGVDTAAGKADTQTLQRVDAVRDSLDVLDTPDARDTDVTGVVSYASADDPAGKAPASAGGASLHSGARRVTDAQDHTLIWASALKILAEDAAPSPVVSEEPEYVPRHMARPVPKRMAQENPVDGVTAVIDLERMRAVAEGRRATQMHNHVNNLIEEELNKIASVRVRRSGREFLRVIQGGTASMPRLQAEA